MIEGYKDIEFVSDYFYEDIKTLYRKSGRKSILLIFDEIENITFNTSISPNWASGDSFIKFWQVIRSTYQKYKTENIFTYLITGTNPKCIEKSTINKVDNPIFAQFPANYIEAFDYDQTKEMIDKLGGYMGIKFDDAVCGKLVEDFGGHPLLMRQMCSFTHKKLTEDRPFTVNKTFYDLDKERFLHDDEGFMKYAQMVLEVLENWYPDEFNMLTWLSIGEYETFKGLANVSPEYVTHLLNYGIIQKSGDDYGFKIDALKLYLSNKNRYKKLNLSDTDKQNEISRRRNNVEPILRRIIKNQLRASFGEEEAKKKIITEIYGAKDINKFISVNYTDFFDPNKHNIFFKHLVDVMKKNWEPCFRNIFNVNVEIFNAKLTLINYYRKPDAHAAPINDADFQSFRGAIEWLEGVISDY